MEFKFVLGVDQSKKWFDCCLMTAQLVILLEERIDNTPSAIFDFISKLVALGHFEDITQVLLAIEATGIYTEHLTNSWLLKGGELAMLHASKISEHLAGSSGFEEKNDRLDARRVSEYAIRFSDKLKKWKPKTVTLQLLQGLQRQRERLIKAMNVLEVPIKEKQEFDTVDISQTLAAYQSDSVKALQEDLNKLEKNIQKLIDTDPYLNQLYQLVISVEGIGPVTAREILIATEGFTKFKPDQAKAFAKYVGVIPNGKRSGTSVKKKDKIGKRKHKKLKSNLTLGANSLIRSKLELGQYYRRKISEGKHHLCVINAMRNKMILRVFAVVRNQINYQKDLNISIQ